MNGWTPGPWHASPNARFIYNEAGWPVGDALVYHGKFTQAEMHANAQLIAAAPDMAEALQALLTAVDTNELASAMACHSVAAFANVMDAIEPARAALAKAGATA